LRRLGSAARIWSAWSKAVEPKVEALQKVLKMNPAESDIRIRHLEDTDLGDITALDEQIGGEYRPEVWERRVGYYLRRDPEALIVAEAAGKVVGFMLGEVRSGEFGLEEPTGWIEVLGVHPEYRGHAIGRRLADKMLEHFRDRGATSVRTLVDENMTDIAQFFSSLGFEPAALRSFAKNL
jgi:ribosomal protein S18 acetylase RimI-like enzyme